ncbi:hypothetical protein [Mesorhizobium sp. B283B1A]
MTDESGNVVIGDVVAIDCENSCLRSRGRLLSAIGLKNVAVVSTADANFVAPVAESQHVRRVVERLGNVSSSKPSSRLPIIMFCCRRPTRACCTLAFNEHRRTGRPWE